MERKEEELGTENLFYDNGIIWLTGISDNRLYRYDVKIRKTTLFYIFEEEKEDQEFLFRAIAKKGSLLYFIPFAATALYIIDISTNEVRKREIAPPDHSGYKDYYPDKKFSAYAWHGNSIFLIGTTYPAIVKYDYAADNMIYISNWFGQLQRGFAGKTDFIFNKICVDEKRIFAPCCRSSSVLEINMETLEYKIHNLRTEVKGFIAICKNRDKFWLLPRNGEKIICWDILKGTNKQFAFEKNEADQMNFYSDLFEADNGHIILLGGGAKDTLLLNTEDGTAEILNKRLYGLGPFSYAGKDEHVCYVVSLYFRLLIKIQNKKICFQRIYSPKYCNYLESQTVSFIQRESKTNTLEELIDELYDREGNFSGKRSKAVCGETIWNEMKARL